MLCSLVYAELTAAPFISLITSAPHHHENSERRCAQRPAFHLPLSTANRLTPVESADPKNGRVTPLQSADPKTKHLKSFRIRRSEKRWGGGHKLLTSIVAARISRSHLWPAHLRLYNGGMETGQRSAQMHGTTVLC